MISAGTTGMTSRTDSSKTGMIIISIGTVDSRGATDPARRVIYCT